LEKVLLALFFVIKMETITMMLCLTLLRMPGQAVIQQLQTQIADVKQQIIALLAQLIQIIQEKIKQLQAQLQLLPQ